MDPFVSYLLVGIVLVLIGFLVIRKGSQKKNRCTASASAVIVEVQVEKDTSDSENNTGKKYNYTPIYEFTVNGNTIRKSGGIYSNNKKEYHVGDTSMVMYNPDKPEEFLVNGKSGGKSFGIALILLGLFIIAIAFTQR